jgi:hypothetical protein
MSVMGGMWRRWATLGGGAASLLAACQLVSGVDDMTAADGSVDAPRDVFGKDATRDVFVPQDAGHDAVADTGHDAGHDAGRDAVAEAGEDGRGDSGHDAVTPGDAADAPGHEAGPDGGDAASDARDSGPDAHDATLPDGGLVDASWGDAPLTCARLTWSPNAAGCVDRDGGVSVGRDATATQNHPILGVASAAAGSYLVRVRLRSPMPEFGVVVSSASSFPLAGEDAVVFRVAVVSSDAGTHQGGFWEFANDVQATFPLPGTPSTPFTTPSEEYTILVRVDSSSGVTKYSGTVWSGDAGGDAGLTATCSGSDAGWPGGAVGFYQYGYGGSASTDIVFEALQVQEIDGGS